MRDHVPAIGMSEINTEGVGSGQRVGREGQLHFSRAQRRQAGRVFAGRDGASLLLQGPGEL